MIRLTSLEQIEYFFQPCMNMESTTALYQLMKDPDQNREHSLYFLADNEYNKQHSLQSIYANA